MAAKRLADHQRATGLKAERALAALSLNAGACTVGVDAPGGAGSAG